MLTAWRACSLTHLQSSSPASAAIRRWRPRSWSIGPQGTLVKLCIGDFAAEHYEIATYTMLITAAQLCRDKETVRACQKILPDEEEMARWLEEHLVTFSRQVARAPKRPEEEEQGQTPVDVAGRLWHNYLYAVFDPEDQSDAGRTGAPGRDGC